MPFPTLERLVRPHLAGAPCCSSRLSAEAHRLAAAQASPTAFARLMPEL
jgi:hypothetical protein